MVKSDLPSGESHREPAEQHFYSAHESDTTGDKALEKPELKQAEENAGPKTREESAEPRFFRSEGGASPSKKKKPFYLRKSSFIGGGIIGGSLGLGIAGFLFFMPLKIETMVQGLQNHYFGVAQQDVSKESQSLLEKYFQKRVIPGYNLGGCKSTIDKHCFALRSSVGNSTNPVSKLYDAWSQNKLETKLATDYGIELQKKPDGWYLKTPTTSGDGVNIGKDGEKIDEGFNKVGASDIRQAIKDETKWSDVMFRYKVGRLLEEKYGIKRCLLFCGIKDSLAGKIAEQKKAAQLLLVQRVIEPHDQNLAVILSCLLQGCDATTAEPNADPAEVAADGAAANPSTDVAVSENLRTIAAEFGILDESKLQSLQNIINNAEEDGYQKAIITEVLTNAGVDAGASKTISSLVPIAGWINMAAQLVKYANHAGPVLKKLRYVENSATAVSLYMTYRTYADEIHTGKVKATEVGSWVDSLGPGKGNDKKNPELGGTADASATPLYHELMDGNKDPNTNGSSTYKCNNGKAVPKGQLVCPEEDLGGGVSIANSITSAINIGGGVIPTLASIWNNTIGKLFGVVNDLTSIVFKQAAQAIMLPCKIPGANTKLPNCIAMAKAKQLVPQLVSIVANWVIPNPFSTNMSGGRKFDEMAAGADVSANDYAHNGIGGQALTNSQVATIRNANQQDAKQQFANQPLFAQLFSTNSQYSLVSRLALAMPYSLSGADSSMMALISNPLSSLSSSFGDLLNMKVSADSSPSPDAFGVPQYGYTQADLNAIGDPETYWNQNCVNDPTQGYQKGNTYNLAASTTLDPNTEEPLNTQTNPCELIMATTGSDGGYFDSSLLTSDDLADVNGSSSQSGTSSSTSASSTSTSSSGGFTNPFPGGWIPNRLDMGYDGTFSGQLVAPFNGTITYAGPFTGWNGSQGLIIKADSDVGLPTRSLYFTEGVVPIVQSGQHVTAGTPIGKPAPSPYGNPYGHGSNGAIEWGVSQDGPVGSQVDTEAIALGLGSAASRQMVLNFAQWAEKNLGLPPPSTNVSAGNT